MKPTILPLLLALILAGCSAPAPPKTSCPPPPATPPPLPAPAEIPGHKADSSEENQRLFLLGLDELLADGSSETLARLADDGTAGKWQERARDLLAGSKHGPEQGREPEGIRQQLRACQANNESLSKENASLKNDLTQLKRILVEMETSNK